MKKLLVIYSCVPLLGLCQVEDGGSWMECLGKSKNDPLVQSYYETYQLGFSGFNDETGVDVTLDDSGHVKAIVLMAKKYKDEMPFGFSWKSGKAEFDRILGGVDYKKKSGALYAYGYRNKNYEIWFECKDKKCEKAVEMKMTYIPSSFSSANNRTVINASQHTYSGYSSQVNTNSLSAMDRLVFEIDTLRKNFVDKGITELYNGALPENLSDTLHPFAGSARIRDGVGAYLHYKDANRFLYRIVLKQYTPAEFTSSQQDIEKLTESFNQYGIGKPYAAYTGSSWRPPLYREGSANLMIYRSQQSGASIYEELVLWESPAEGVRYLEYRWNRNY